MEQENFMNSLLTDLKDKFTIEVNERTAKRIDAVSEMCHVLDIKPSTEDGQPNHTYAKMIGQNKAVIDDFGTGYWAKVKAVRLEKEATTKDSE